jgi:hypothetical protein
MTPLMASLLRYLATAHVCDDVASADDFAELIQMLAGEVEELVHEAVPSSRPQNASADGDGTDSVRIDEDEFHDVDEEAAAAARMQAIVRGRAVTAAVSSGTAASGSQFIHTSAGWLNNPDTL